MTGRTLGNDVVIVTAADARYFDLVTGLVLSIRDLEAANGSAPPMAVKVVDLGLTEAQRSELSANCDVAPIPDDGAAASRKDLATPFFLSRTVKSRMRDFFPGFSVYLWIDSDAWVQDWRALELLVAAGRGNGFAAVPEIDRAYQCIYEKDSYHFKENFKRVSQGFGEAAAQDLMFRPVINSGVVALRSDSPLWEIWHDAVVTVFQNATTYTSDQAALNYVFYQNRVSFHPLPSWCNWLCCHARPRLDLERRILTEPLLPFYPIGILHLTETARDKAIAVPLSDGSSRMLHLDYLNMRKLRALWAAPRAY